MSDSDSDEPPFKRARSTIWKRKKRKEQESDSFDSSDTFITADAASTAVNPSEEVASDSDKTVAEDSSGTADINRSESGKDAAVSFEDSLVTEDQTGTEDEDFIIDSEEDRVEEEHDEVREEPEEHENRGAFGFNQGGDLDNALVVHGYRTVKEALVLDLALSVRHKWTYECLIENFTVKNLLFDSKLFPTSKKELFRTIGRDESGMVPYVYCECGNLLGKKEDLPEVFNCACSKEIVKSKAKLFYRLSLKQQLKQFLETPGVPELLKYRERRKKKAENSVEDVFDAKRYKELQKTMTPLDFTYVFNTDGCKIGKKAKIGIYPLFIRLNELPPNLRQKFLFLVGLFGDKDEPNMECFLSPLVDELNEVSTEGVQWYPDGNTENEVQVSRFLPLCSCVDGKASWQMLNMNSHLSPYACSLCTFKGVSINGTQRFPALPHPEIPPYEARTHGKMVQDMLQASAHPEAGPVLGHRGLSALVTLRHYDLVEGKAFDDLHFLYECAAKHHFELLLKVAPRVKDPVTKQPLSYASIERTFDERLKKIKTPSKIARKPASMKIKNRDSFTGTEWKNLLMYYAVPCLEGLIAPTYIKHFEMLSVAAHTLSRDEIYEEDIKKAEKLIDKYLEKYEEYYGIEKTRLNLHCIKHAGESVRNLGPLWAYSTFNFESWNHKLLTKISSPRAPLLQIMVRHYIRIFLLYLIYSTSEGLSDDVKEKCANILEVKKMRSYSLQIEEHVYMLGKMLEERPPTAVEAEILEREGVSADVTLQFFEKIIINGCEYQTRSSTKVTELSDNSMIYTKQDTFCTIQKIVLCIGNEGDTTPGLLVNEHDVLLQPGPHIVSALCPQVFDLLHFVQSDSVKCPVVQIRINDALHVAPMPNTFEID